MHCNTRSATWPPPQTTLPGRRQQGRATFGHSRPLRPDGSVERRAAVAAARGARPALGQAGRAPAGDRLRLHQRGMPAAARLLALRFDDQCRGTHRPGEYDTAAAVAPGCAAGLRRLRVRPGPRHCERRLPPTGRRRPRRELSAARGRTSEGGRRHGGRG
eukprot:5157040-Prymnesium_polylepis.1